MKTNNRRGFLKKLSKGIAAVAVGVKVAPPVVEEVSEWCSVGPQLFCRRSDFYDRVLIHEANHVISHMQLKMSRDAHDLLWYGEAPQMPEDIIEQYRAEGFIEKINELK